jgi:ketosteroid isomerase-like protein
MDEPTGDASVQRATTEARIALVSALRGNRPEQAAALYAVDARLLAPSADVIEGRASIEAYWRAGLEAGIDELRLEPIELDRRDNTAFEIGRYSLRVVSSGGSLVVDRGNYLVVHQLQGDGSWSWAIQTFNPDRPPGPRLDRKRRSSVG